MNTVVSKGLCAADYPVPTMVCNSRPWFRTESTETIIIRYTADKLMRARLIASGRLRPWANELAPIQLAPGTVVFRIQPDVLQ